MEMGLIIIFWYGALHAFGADHLTAIADFSIGESVKKTLLTNLTNVRRVFTTAGVVSVAVGTNMLIF
jgi:hypothetical protein